MSQTASTDEFRRNPEQAVHIKTPSTTDNNPKSMDLDTKNAILVVAALVLTTTYQAALQPPGGLWQDDTNSNNHTAGKAIMGTKIPGTYVTFLFFNSMGFFGSFIVIWYLVEGFPMKKELRLAMLAIVITYDVSMGALTPDEILNWIFVGISILMPFLFMMIVKLADCVHKLRRKLNPQSS